MTTETVLERPPQAISERIARLEEHKEHVATKRDIAEVKGTILESNAELRRFIERAVSQSEANTLATENQLLKKIIGWGIPIGIVIIPAMISLFGRVLQLTSLSPIP